MKLAQYQHQTIYLPEFPRQRYEELYQASIRGEILCCECQKPLFMTLSIHDLPHFIHSTIEQTTLCRHVVELKERNRKKQSEDEMNNIREVNGFRMPAKRAISETNDEEVFLESKQYHSIPPFSKKSSSKEAFSISNLTLDANQWEAVTYIGSPLLVLAGAGSGKTRVITSRAIHMMSTYGIRPHEMMLVTFTSKAAQEMKERIKSFGYSIADMEIGTFHSIFYKMLLRFDRQLWDSSRLIKFDFQKENMLKQLARQLDIEEKSFAFDQAIQQIGLWKNSFIYPSDIKPSDTWEEQVAALYEGYENSKKQQNLFDFDDMLIGCYEMLLEHPILLKQYQSRYKCLLVDEFQDINKIQFLIIKLLFQDTSNITVVGDDDQSIYAFRGSNPDYLLQFQSHFSNAKILHLSENYRSTHSIVSLANETIKGNNNRFAKSMNAQHHSGQVPIFFFPYDEEEEATMIVSDIKEKIKNGAKPEQFAVLYRTNTASRAIFERLIQTSLPFTIDQDGESFYDRPIIRKMISLLMLTQDEDHQGAIKELLPVLFLKQQALQEAKMNSVLQNLTFLEALTTINSAAPFQIKKIEKLIKLIRTIKELPPLEAIERLEESPAFMDYLKKRGNEANKIERPSDDIRDLKVVSKNFKSQREFVEHAFHISAKFKEYRSQKNKQSTSSISLLTAHRSKGLEYDYVYLLGTVDGGFPHDYALEALKNGDSTQIEEERRLLYVAITRARNSLYLSILQRRRNKKANPSRLIKRLIPR
ncbi:ATP-dependent helicase [Bacillus sp. RG28]|uniref:DNA 3'-5' helicase n=1 Tax=Gottfriedia endophytica TaxID=2820819 RepID=A0A940NPP2_9BACI|nr:ATP-dependent helicase [Gottfriedia endophytica]MBP0724616.1 ATP-dependent helicase [Gottfriedia endophytica]